MTLIIIYDLDDTLIATRSNAISRLSVLILQHHLRTNPEELYSLIGTPNRTDLLRDKIPDPYSFWSGYERLRETMLPSPIGDISLLRRNLDREGIGMGVLTNNNQEKARAKLGAAGVDPDSLSCFLCQEDLPAPKPNPRCFEALPQHLRGGTIYVGDEVSDSLAAHGAGIPFVGVLTGTTTPEQFILAGVPSTRIMPTAHDILRYIS